MLGLKHATVQLVSHNPSWRYLFQEEVISIRRVLNNKELQIEHVGSTAIPDIVAKPILDMFIPYHDIKNALKHTKALAKLGYELITDAENYKLFIKGSGEVYTHHLSFTSPTNDYWKETLLFRDYLLANPDIAKSYEVEKIKLASTYANSRRNYTVNKARFIQTILRQITTEQSKTIQNEAIVINNTDLRNYMTNQMWRSDVQLIGQNKKY